MKKTVFLPLAFFLSIAVHAQFSAYDPFDDNSNDWIAYKNDSAEFAVRNGYLDMNAVVRDQYINAKGATIVFEKNFRTEISADFVSGNDSTAYGICWGAADIDNFHAFYITPAGKYGFRTFIDKKAKEVITPKFSPAINVKGANWLRITMRPVSEGVVTLVFCINEQVVDSTRGVKAFGNYFGAFLGGTGHIHFDNFIVYQRGAKQDEFEPVDLSLSLQCKADQLHYTNAIYGWSCCVQHGCRVDVDSNIVRFWYTDQRAGDYSVILAPMESLGSVDFFRAAEQDFRDYLAEGDSIINVKADKPVQISIGNETKVWQFGEIYTASDIKGNLYIRRFYVDHPYGVKKGFVFQFIVPENSPYIPVLDQLTRQVIATLQDK